MANNPVGIEKQEDNLAVGAKGGAVAFILKIASSLLGFLNQIVLARILGAAGVGEVLLALSLVKISTQIAKFGMEETMMRFIPVYIEHNDNERLKGSINFALKFCFAISIIFFFLILLLAKIISINVFHSATLHKLLLFVAVAIPAAVIRDVIGGILKGYKDAYRALVPESIISPLLRLVIFLLLSLHDITPLYAIFAFVSGELLAMLLSIRFLLQKMIKMKSVKGRCENKKILEVAYSIIFASVSLFLYTQTDIWILGIFKTKEVVGIYGVAAKLVLLIYFPMFAFASIIPPMMSSTYTSGNYKELERITRESSRWILSIAMPIILILFLEGELVLRYFYGQEFVAGYLVLIILMTVHLINTSTGLVGIFLQMTGQHKLYMKINIFFGILNVILNIILVPPFGMEGAAVATALCLSLLEIVCTLIIYKKFSVLTLAKGVKFDIFFILTVLVLYKFIITYNIYLGIHILFIISSGVYLLKSIVKHDIPWRLLLGRQ
jgi:O-antigen/teichoic acid export membrane protein